MWLLLEFNQLLRCCLTHFGFLFTGTPKNEAEPAIVKVTVTDVNDNAPRFNNIQDGVIPAFVYENKDNNSLIVQVTAVDPDEGDNAKVSYSILGGKIIIPFYFFLPTLYLFCTNIEDRA